MIKTYITFGIFLLLISSCAIQNKDKEQKRRPTAEDLISINRRMVSLDADAIKVYVEENNLQMKETKTGLWYHIDSEGEGDLAVKGDVVELSFEITLLDGTACYSSDSLGNKRFKVGQGGVEPGLEEGILLLNKGAKATFIMPPHRAHGLVGDDDKIPGRKSIIYKVEVVDIKRES
ncbi:FKBP-type peptidyl-prolyl cis-trans isomerase [Plebeiibacterium sediminum]|uniref:Peptidyl-prolyl cis-trans isomerase n=1 Tax=Plebeiibacterium sediminum TaxID=2992112 RepID=A0AAE3M4A5_9BACT|nr:FKBP-type peptidyl-prolyl cis-trans isomerase [Plebeiobacterium sediminum]MCW3786967.1 FKBP-type peptidyl-prolyl cis-trans isomerase [Plebeiobacterium sediminum]